MADFKMCGFCAGQYLNRADRRYHAQTISCHECGPNIDMSLISLAASLIQGGKVVAVKGVGGYNLICDPFQDKAVSRLREVKHREQKPFAVMFLNASFAGQYCEINEVERRLLESSAKPILLLEQKEKAPLHSAEFERSRFIGAFLPSTGLHRLLLEACGKPLIVTSANVSGLPMIKGDEEMLALAEGSKGLIAETLSHAREIRVAVDDSVVRVIDGKPQMIRRSKGYAPVPLFMGANFRNPEKNMASLACGGQLKSSFALNKGAFSYVSQYFGDLDSIENMRIYEENVERMKSLFGIEPRIVICDMHPLYDTTRFAEKYAAQNGCDLIKVQHHHAHVASVMAEHHLPGPVIGVSFDGTGYGADGKIWGGEFLICEGSGFKRDSHLKYVKMLGGDSSMKEAWKSAICHIIAYDGKEHETIADDEIIIDISDIIAAGGARENNNWDTVKRALDNGINAVESSSMGRLFDAVSSLLGICHENSYEGECAILLEDAAARALKRPGEDLTDDLALSFHLRVATMICERCVKIRDAKRLNKVALTGGVFQNKILMEKALELLRGEGFDVYYNISVSPNDGGIALGQSYIGFLSLA